MNSELFDARAKLARLKCRESELVEELLDVHKAVAAQKLVIDELIKASAIPHINRLPNELFAQIFLLIRLEREKLACVSRRWRDIIFDTPSIWSEIHLSCYEGFPDLLELHLERSRQTPLTVSLGSNQQPELDIVLPHVNRIHVLRIFGDAGHIIDRLASFTFPALEFLHVDVHAQSADSLLSLYSRAPTLKCLQLRESYHHPFRAGTPPGHPSTSTPQNPYLNNIPFQSLAHLSLGGAMDSRRLPRDSIHFPVLESLELRTKYPMSFLEAIVAPKLQQFEFSRILHIIPEYKEFDGPLSKFDNVRHIGFAASSGGNLFPYDASDLAQEFCYVFPGVRHAKIHMQHLHPLFSPCQTVGHPHIPIDNWTRLETLEIQDFDVNKVDEDFVNWFRKRKDLGFHLKLICERRTANRMLRVSRVVLRSGVFPDVSLGVSKFIAVGQFNQVNPTDLAALARACSTEPADMLRAQFWTL
ncbi:hypothetical protein EDD15DRAFT_2370652 [Pisolithus albus]|nr:hypothetical protein EDD15DRAFT_2370652 [Pisolithus albus]